MDAQGLYQQQSVETASPAKLISMLYHAAIQRIGAAEQQLERGEVELANATLQRTQAIVMELRSSLDHDRGGEIAGNLSSLYSFCIERLIEANSTKDVALLPVVRSILEDLADAWDQMAAEQLSSAPPPAAHSVSGAGQAAASG